MKRLSLLASLLTLAACGATGGPVAGAADTHCGAKVVTVDPAQCSASPGGDGAETEEVRFGSEADDDDCKYHVTWTSTAVEENRDVTFTVTLKTKLDSKPVTGALPDTEAFLSSTHPAPNSGQATTETGAGTYKIGPVRFDAKGKWTVRFHFFETCEDTEASPHGHAAFYLDVP